MKKLLLLFVAAGMTIISGCEGERGSDGRSVESEVFEILNENFTLNSNGEYTIYRTLDPLILPADTMLIYRLVDTIDNQTPIWQLIPQTLYVQNSQDEVDYNYDFSKEDFTIYAGGNFDLATRPEYITNQTFRIVIVPGYMNSRSALDTSDYYEVVKSLGLEGKPVVQM